MIRVLRVAQTFACVVLWLQKVLLYLSWQSVQWHDHISGVSYLLKLDVGHFLVAHVGWVVCGNIPWEFWDLFLGHDVSV